MRRLTPLLAFAAALLIVGAAPAQGAIGDIETPTVFGPEATSADSYPFLATDIDLAARGYVEEEFEYEGDAFRYDRSGDLDVTATKIETGGEADDGRFPYRTRMIVRRPADPADFNGTLVVEWLNVTAGYDLEANWFGDPEYLIANGYAWVGISAQRSGVNSLKAFDAARYGDLDIPEGAAMPATPEDDTDPPGDNDPLSFEIYSAGIKALLGEGAGADPLGGLATPTTVLASGESQSGGRLSTHHNKIQPLHEIIDGFLITVSNGQVRDDRPEKVIRVLSETENRTQRTEPDDDSYRHWEVAGGSHVPRMAYDNWQVPVDRDTGGQDVACERFPLSFVQWPFVVNSAIAQLDSWSNGGPAPPIAPRGVYDDEGELVRDATGLAQGGIRLPEMTVPVALNTGSNGPAPDGPPLSIFCILLGSYETFTDTALTVLYTDHADYVNQVTPAAQAVADQGFILQQDVPRLIQQHDEFPNLRPTVPVRSAGKGRNRGRFTLSWRGTAAEQTSFRLEHSEDGGETWTPVRGAEAVTSSSLSFTGRGEKDGTWIYRVRSSTVVPANVVEAEKVITTPFSDASTETTVDGRKPKLKLKCPRRVEVGSRAFARVKAKDKGVGLRKNPSGRRKIKTGRPGVRKIKVKATDRLGNSRKRSCRVRVVR